MWDFHKASVGFSPCWKEYLQKTTKHFLNFVRIRLFKIEIVYDYLSISAKLCNTIL